MDQHNDCGKRPSPMGGGPMSKIADTLLQRATTRGGFPTKPSGSEISTRQSRPSPPTGIPHGACGSTALRNSPREAKITRLIVPPAKSASVKTRSLSVTNAAPPSPPLWLAEWKIEEPLFERRAIVAAALAAAEDASIPADPRSVAAALEQTLELYGMPANWEAVADFYLEAFEDVPLDLVLLACKRLRRSPQSFFPKPGEIRSLIVDDLYDRKRTLAKLQVAQSRRRDPEPEYQPPTEAEKRQVEKLVKGSLKRMNEVFVKNPVPLMSPSVRPREREQASKEERRQAQVAADALAGFRLPDENDPRVLARLREMGVPTAAAAEPVVAKNMHAKIAPR